MVALCIQDLTGRIKALPVNQDDLWGDIAELIDKIRQQSDLFNSSHMHVCSMHTKYAHAFVSEDYFFIF